MTVTPMMSQWQACKEQAKEALLLFRLGDFYEAFCEDAKVISKELSLTLTARQGVPMCGVPFHAAEGYIDKLIAKGFKVAIAEQTEDPKMTKGLIKREIVRVITPGTLVHSQLLSEKKNNFFVAIVQMGSVYALAALDLTTAEFRTREFEKEQPLMDELHRLKPKELLVSQSFSFLKELSYSFAFLANERPFDPKRCLGHFPPAANFLLLYLKEELNLSLEHIHSIQTQPEFMQIDRSTMRNLELNESFFDLLDETVTPMGGRLLFQWVQYPLLSPTAIRERQEEIQSFLHQPEKSKKARDVLSCVRDLERLMMRISTRCASPRDVFALGVSLSHLPKIKEILDLKELFDASALADQILSAICSSPPLRITEGNVFKDGYNKELDRLRLLAKDSMSWMANYQLQLREQTGIKTLKVGYTKAFGYYIEVSRSQSEKIPPTFQRRQTLINAERFITSELKDFEHQVLTAEERARAIEEELFEELIAEIAKEASHVYRAAKIIARIDALLSLAKVAGLHEWVCPIVDASDRLEICEGRHPVVEKAIGKASFIPNDTLLHPEQQLMLITGPNMAGKSTYIRQVALLVILTQIGSFIPAKSARIGVVDKIFSRIGASDDLARGQSTFMVEMSETANILNNVTSSSLVLLDEIGRGTSTYDGIAIAWAVAEYLLTTPNKQAKTLFATHYWELTQLEQEYAHAANFQTAVQEIPSGIVFLRKIIRGGTDKSYGVHVAKLANLPPKVIQRAEELLQKLEKKPCPSIPAS